MIRAAAARIAPHIRRTPMLRLPAGALAPVPLALKLECLQLSGSFKARGAFNSMLALPVPGAGVIAASGGNHGAAVAAAAQALGVAAEIFVPEITGQAKRARILDFGARLVVGGASYDEARLASEARAALTGARLIHAYDQPEVLAGQGTLALACAEDAPECTHWLVAVGGGGLIGGMAQFWSAGAGPRLVAVEPAACPCLSDAMAAGRPVPSAAGGVAADSLGARQIGALGFSAIMAHGAVSVLVTDAAITEARRAIWDACRILVEPGGAAALAALRSGAWVPPEGARVGVLLCGANTEATV
jgi:threonine dehydratase